MNLHFDPQQPVSVTSIAPSGNGPSATARILSISGRRMNIECDIQVVRGTSLKVEWPPYCVLGEVVTIIDPGRSLTLQIRHALSEKEIDQLRQRWV